MVKAAKDPNAMLNHMATQNPQLKEIMDLVNGGKSPKDLFYERANQMGINPDDILNQLK